MYAASGVHHPDPVILIAMCHPGPVRVPECRRSMLIAGSGRRLHAITLRAEVVAGRLDSEAVEAALAATGHRVPARRGIQGQDCPRR